MRSEILADEDEREKEEESYAGDDAQTDRRLQDAVRGYEDV